MPRRCRPCFVVSGKVQFVWNDGRQAAIAIFRCAGFPVDLEHHRFVLAVTADFFIAETFHICCVECVAPEMPILFQPGHIIYFRVNLPHCALGPVFSDRLNEMLSDQSAKIESASVADDQMPYMPNPYLTSNVPPPLL